MDLAAKGRTLMEGPRTVEAVKLAELAGAIGTASAPETARLVAFFGPVLAGEEALVAQLGLDYSKALLVGQSYEWTRPLEPGESLQVRVYVEDVYEKGDNVFGVVATEMSDVGGSVVQRQRTTFIERQAK